MNNLCVSLLLCFFITGCATTSNEKKPLNESQVILMLAAASDLTRIQIDHLSNKGRRVSDFQFTLDVKPVEMSKYIESLYAEHELQIGDDKKNATLDRTTVITVPAKYSFAMHNEELVLLVEWRLPGEVVRVTRAYSDNNETINPPTTFVIKKDVKWKLGGSDGR